MGVVVEGPHFSVHVDPLQGVLPLIHKSYYLSYVKSRRQFRILLIQPQQRLPPTRNTTHPIPLRILHKILITPKTLKQITPLSDHQQPPSFAPYFVIRISEFGLAIKNHGQGRKLRRSSHIQHLERCKHNQPANACRQRVSLLPATACSDASPEVARSTESLLVPQPTRC